MAASSFDENGNEEEEEDEEEEEEEEEDEEEEDDEVIPHFNLIEIKYFWSNVFLFLYFVQPSPRIVSWS